MRKEEWPEMGREEIKKKTTPNGVGEKKNR